MVHGRPGSLLIAAVARCAADRDACRRINDGHDPVTQILERSEATTHYSAKLSELSLLRSCPVEYDEYVHAIEGQIAPLIEAFAPGSLEVVVPTCPDWTLRDLAKHVGEFSGFWAHVICESMARPRTPFEPIPENQAVAAWYQDLAGHLLAELRATPPDATVWTWVPEDHTARFIARRVSHELSVHRFDAQLTRGHADTLDADLAIDGIEEIFVMIDAWKAQGPPETGRGTGETLHLHALDREAEWLLTLAPDGLEIDRRHGKADLALRGAVSDLELTLYQRPPLGQVERIGDESALSAWYRAFTFG